MNKTVVLISNAAWNVFNFRLNLLEAIKNTGYRVVVLAPKDEYSKKIPFEYHHIYLNKSGINPFEDLVLICRLYVSFKRIKPDIILNFTIKPTIYATLAAKLAGIPCINNITGLGTLFIRGSWCKWIGKLLYRLVFPLSARVFFQNPDDKELFQKLGMNNQTITDLLPGSGVDTEKFIPIERVSLKKFSFLLISRMLWDKGIGEYVEAAKVVKKKYKDIEFQLLGYLSAENRSAISSEKIKSWVKEGAVDYLGGTIDVRPFIANADCVVLPSYREGTPRSLLEAASMAKPIITTDTVGCREAVVNSKNGFLCKVKDAYDLAEKMEKMINISEQDRIEMGRYGREKMRREFDEKIVIKKYIDAVREILFHS